MNKKEIEELMDSIKFAKETFSELIGKKIISAEVIYNKNHDDINEVILTCDDSKKYSIISSFGDYTGNSKEEYPSYISCTEVIK